LIRLGVNLDHIATVRNARGEAYPNPVQAALLAELGGADNITCHLREDRRHIRDRDVELLKETINIPLNFEMAATDEMVGIAERLRPHAVTLVPEKRQELTTEGGLSLDQADRGLAAKIERLKKAEILVSLFVEADTEMIRRSRDLGVQAIEIHTGNFCHQMNEARTTKEQWSLVAPFIKAAELSHDCGLQLHFGHGLHYHNAYWLQVIPYCEEANIGHAIIARALFVGLRQAVQEMKVLLNDRSYQPQAMSGV